jgi:hypothetical protein
VKKINVNLTAKAAHTLVLMLKGSPTGEEQYVRRFRFSWKLRNEVVHDASTFVSREVTGNEGASNMSAGHTATDSPTVDQLVRKELLNSWLDSFTPESGAECRVTWYELTAKGKKVAQQLFNAGTR